MKNNSISGFDDISVLRKAFEHLDQAVIIAASDRQIVYANKKAEHLFEYTRQELITHKTSVLYADYDDYLRLGTALFNPHPDQEGEVFTIRYRTKYGRVFDGRVSGGVITDDDDKPRYFVGMVTDETTRLKAERALNKLHLITSNRELSFQERVDNILQLGSELFGLPISILSKIDKGVFVVKQAFHPDNNLKKDMAFNLSETYCAHVYEANDATGFNHVSSSEIANHACFKKFGLESFIGVPIFVDGERYGTISFSGSSPCRKFIKQDYDIVRLFSAWIGHEIAINNYIQEIEIAREKVNILANTDALTGLANRRAIEHCLDDHLKKVRLKHSSLLTVAIVDFDLFKNINDTYGHEVGDKALKRFADIFHTVCRREDACGRWGGEEFLLIFPNSNTDDANAIVERLAYELKKVIFEDAPQLSLTVSVGLASFEAGDDRNALIARADKCMYHAKISGRDRVVHTLPTGT